MVCCPRTAEGRSKTQRDVQRPLGRPRAGVPQRAKGRHSRGACVGIAQRRSLCLFEFVGPFAHSQKQTTCAVAEPFAQPHKWITCKYVNGPQMDIFADIKTLTFSVQIMMHYKLSLAAILFLPPLPRAKWWVQGGGGMGDQRPVFRPFFSVSWRWGSTQFPGSVGAYF